MSIYAGLLDHILDQVPPGRSSGEELAELLRCRKRLVGEGARPTGSEGASSALAEQLSYDAALIVLARRHDIECSSQRFGQPIEERVRLERALAARGICLDWFDFEGGGLVEGDG